MAKLEAAATLGVVAFLGAIGFLIYKNWNNIAGTLMSPFKAAGETGEQIQEDVTTFPDKVIGAIEGTQEPCAYLKGVLADVPYNACMAAYGRLAPFNPLPPINEAQREQMENPNYNVDSPCSLNPATGGFICRDPAVPTEIPQEAINASLELTHELAADMRSQMYPSLVVGRLSGSEYSAPLHVCINGRRSVTREEAIWPEMYARYGWDYETSDKLLFRNGCGIEGDGMGNSRYYCDC